MSTMRAGGGLRSAVLIVLTEPQMSSIDAALAEMRLPSSPISHALSATRAARAKASDLALDAALSLVFGRL